MISAHCFVVSALLSLVYSTAAFPETDDQGGNWSLVVENDLFQDADRFYTNGIRIGHALPERLTPGWLESIAAGTGLFPDSSEYRSVFTLGQNMYTPRDITVPIPDPEDRPYAGWLYATAGIAGVKDDRLNSLELSVGVVGPASGAGEVQDWFHGLIGADDPQGWDFQLENELALMATYQRQWNARNRDLGPFEIGFSPHAGFAVGNVFTYANGGATLRFGQDMEQDFGPPRIQPSVPGAGLVGTDGWGWYVFASAEGRAVAQNIFLDGNTFVDSPSVDKHPFVADVQLGFVLGTGAVKLGYTHVFRTEEFEGQDDNAGFGAFSLTITR